MAVATAARRVVCPPCAWARWRASAQLVVSVRRTRVCVRWWPCSPRQAICARAPPQEGLRPGDRQVFEDVAQEVLGEARRHERGTTAERAARRDHVAAYWSLITFCHAHAWRDDPAFTDTEREAAYLREEIAMFKMLHRHGC